MRLQKVSRAVFNDYYRDPQEKVKKNYKLVEEIARTGDIDAAYREIFPEINPNKRTRSLQCKLEKWPNLKLHFERLLNVQGLSLITANGKLREMFDAQRPVVVKGKVEMFPDNQARLGAIQTVYRLHKVLGNDTNIVVNDQHKELNISVEDAKAISEIAKELEQLNSKMDLDKHKVKVIDVESKQTPDE
jgi:hypothetical protein